MAGAAHLRLARTDPSDAATPALSPTAALLEAELREGRLRHKASLAVDGIEVEIALGSDALWALVRRRGGTGGCALRCCMLPGGEQSCLVVEREDGRIELALESVLGHHRVSLALTTGALPLLSMTARLTPSHDMLPLHFPRDLYPLGRADRPLSASGVVEAAQRGLNSGLIYLRVTEPAVGSLLYFQNLTALNPWFTATGTKPDGAVGGSWPELGYLPPAPPQRGLQPARPLPAGEEITTSDVRLVLHDDPSPDERTSALRFLQMLATVYPCIDRPGTVFRDWPARARQSLRDLADAPEARVRHYGHHYVRPYVDAEYPDSMVQCSLLGALHDWSRWLGEPVPLERELAAGVAKFRDTRLETLRRYLPNVGKDKDRNAVDSWYMLHPLINLARMARHGDARARRLLLGSLPHAIRAAHHFRYAWPIQFKVDSFEVITAARDPSPLGQTDVGGLYAWLMLEVHGLTGENRYLAEARRAIDAAAEMRFELNYQANLTAWGAAACLRLWRVTQEDGYRAHAYVYLASFIHNCEMWESEIGFARHYSNFLGATALHDAPYMALYECFDSFSAFEHLIADSGPALDPAARMLVSEYCKYALHRAWFYYPDALPEDAIATEQRNGHIDRRLSFPVEDLYPDGQPAGQVGQEIYGAGAAFTFASRAFHRVEGAPFMLFCDHFNLGEDRLGGGAVAIDLAGGEGCVAALSLIREPKRSLDGIRVEAGGDTVRPHHRVRSEGRSGRTERLDYRVPATGRITIHWQD